MKKSILAITILLCLYNSAQAKHVKEVKAILVQLNTEQNRIKYFTKINDSKQVERVRTEAHAMRNKMISDFSDNFDCCPVYYFIDTNYEQIKNKHFSGLLVNKDGSVVTAPILESIDTNYLVLRYGFPDGSSTIRRTQGLVILSHDFRQLFFCSKPDQSEIGKKHTFRSRKYDIEYFPSARHFDEDLRRGLTNLDAN
jgi:hypothetical protein